MNELRYHWFDLGLGLAALVAVFLLLISPNLISYLLWINLIALFLHQVEEYRWPGYFPGMMNSVMFASENPDRYPLNANTALIVNVTVGWLFFTAAAVFGARAVWLGIAVMLVSAGNFIAHSLVFNLKGRTIYNPGMITAVVLFLPIVVFFFYLVIDQRAASPVDWVIGLVLGATMNYLGILKLIDWLKDEGTPYVFPRRFLPPALR